MPRTPLTFLKTQKVKESRKKKDLAKTVKLFKIITDIYQILQFIAIE